MPVEPTPVAELAERVGGRVIGDASVRVQRVASLDSAGAADIAYVENEDFLKAARQSSASCLIVPEGLEIAAPCQIVVKNPKLAFAVIAEVLHPAKRREPQIHQIGRA